MPVSFPDADGICEIHLPEHHACGGDLVAAMANFGPEVGTPMQDRFGEFHRKIFVEYDRQLDDILAECNLTLDQIAQTLGCRFVRVPGSESTY